VDPLGAALESKASLQIRNFVGERPVEILLDSNLLVDLACGSTNFLTGSIRPAIEMRAIRPCVGANQLAELQEYRHTLNGEIRSVTQHLENLDFIIGAGANIFLAEAKWFETNVTDLPGTKLDVHVPSLTLEGQYLYSFWHELWHHLLRAACHAHAFLEQRLSFLKVERKWATRTIAAFAKLTRSTIKFFCCLRWECRRWFLQHGAHPPKASRTVFAGPFAGACSGSSLSV
jgi:hypothetical protein